MNTSQKKKIRIAVIIPIVYKGGSLRGAKELVNALVEGALQSGEEAEIILAYCEKQPAIGQFDNLHPLVKCRSYSWKTISGEDALRAMSYIGHSDWRPSHEKYAVPDDGINHFLDCDAWLFISERMPFPVVPAKPHFCMIYDFLPRHVDFMPSEIENQLLVNARAANKILVTTHFTAHDATQYAGIKSENVIEVPMLVPDFTSKRTISQNRDECLESDYFIWATNTAKHKNHVNSLLALQLYYEDLDGQLACYITGYLTDKLFDFPDEKVDYLIEVKKIYSQSQTLQKKIKAQGELFDHNYQQQLRRAAFLWHTARIDNGTFSVIEAAQLGIPSLSSDYPPMREIDEQFHLDLSWMNSNNPLEMAKQLKYMEINYLNLKKQLCERDEISFRHSSDAAHHYWKVIKACL